MMRTNPSCLDSPPTRGRRRRNCKAAARTERWMCEPSEYYRALRNHRPDIPARCGRRSTPSLASRRFANSPAVRCHGGRGATQRLIGAPLGPNRRACCPPARPDRAGTSCLYPVQHPKLALYLALVVFRHRKHLLPSLE